MLKQKSPLDAKYAKENGLLMVGVKQYAPQTLTEMENGLKKLVLEDGTNVSAENVGKFVDEYLQSITDSLSREHLRFLNELARELGIEDTIEVELDSNDQGDIKKIKVQMIGMDKLTDFTDV